MRSGTTRIQGAVSVRVVRVAGPNTFKKDPPSTGGRCGGQKVRGGQMSPPHSGVKRYSI